MPYLPDTNIWIYHLKKRGGALESRLRQVASREIYFCSVVKAELWHGAEKYSLPEQRREALSTLFAPCESLPFDDDAARHYADIRHQLEVRGEVIGPNDLKIAAIARSRGLTLVSANKEFSRVQGLKIEDWTK